ncbi:MAG TPA: hypothetical protein VG206_22365, partial [Terriglobia bacterium]|nr:hypothetical protein [Terriglobia bacterium]
WQPPGGCIAACNPAQTSFFAQGINGAANGAQYEPQENELLGQWVQYEVYLKASDPNTDNGVMQVYQNGQLWWTVSNQTRGDRCPKFNGNHDCGSMTGPYDASQIALDIGGDWGAINGDTGNNQNMAACTAWGGHTVQQVCPPNGNIPYFHIYIDDVIVLKQ